MKKIQINIWYMLTGGCLQSKVLCLLGIFIGITSTITLVSAGIFAFSSNSKNDQKYLYFV